MFALFAAAALLVAGCSETPQNMGAAVDNDQNVLTGGPITGTTIEDLPAAVKQSLEYYMPRAEISSITRTVRGGHGVYEISFLNPDNPEIYLRDDGMILPDPTKAPK